MRELEFLPDWYPRLRRRKRVVALQTWITVILLTGLCLWGWISQHNIRAASASLVNLKGELTETNGELRLLDEALAQQKKLQFKDRILARLGRHVESTRVLSAVESAMPEDMSLVNFNSEVEETQRNLTGFAASRAQQAGDPSASRRLKVRVVGVGPTDTTVAVFIEKLISTGLFDSVAVSYTRERVENNHEMREFEVTFSVDLDPTDKGAA